MWVLFLLVKYPRSSGKQFARNMLLLANMSLNFATVCGPLDMPISLISAAYKLFAVALLNRLKNAGAESRLSSTQFGFRSQRGSSDAILIARRLLEDAWSRKDSSLILMALDWAKAFDSISPTSLAMALERFGVPPSFINIVASIYSDRKFTVRDCGCTSNKYDQHHGISQGCPLSPFLFSIMMTVLIADASYAVKNTLSNHLPKAIVNELMYADDTLLVAVDSDFAATHMRDIERCGSQYGLSFNWRHWPGVTSIRQQVTEIRYRQGRHVGDRAGDPRARALANCRKKATASEPNLPPTSAFAFRRLLKRRAGDTIDMQSIGEYLDAAAISEGYVDIHQPLVLAEVLPTAPGEAPVPRCGILGILGSIAPAAPDVGELAKATAQLQEAGLELPTCDELADGGRSHPAFVERTIAHPLESHCEDGSEPPRPA
ncbi:pol [Symbiodinium sp. KB8]|nr:pol [Symbiodinium sp. KB8]